MVDGLRLLGGGRKRGRTAFVLGGGGVLGAIQVGQLEALLRAGIVPDMLVGSSVGALNAATIAADPTVETAERLRDVWVGLRPEDIFPGTAMQRVLHFVRKGDHLYPNDGLRRLIDLVPARSFEQMRAPLAVVAANLRTGKERCFTTGPIAPAILASSALPGVFPPVAVDGELYVDGGVVNNVPISRAVEMGATKIYVLTTGTRDLDGPIRRPYEVLLRAFAYSRAARIDLDLERYARDAKIDVLPTFDTGPIRFNDTSHSLRLYRQALELTTAHLAGRSLAKA
jgi:NTE family protein